MASLKKSNLRIIFVLSLYVSASFLCVDTCVAKSDWQKIDKVAQRNVFQLNVGLKLKLRNALWIQVSGLSSKNSYYLFTTNSIDRGYQVIGRGTAFALKNFRKGKHYYITSRHVLENAKQILEECQMFYAAAALYAKQSAPNNSHRFDEILQTLNLLCTGEQNNERALLARNMADAIWDCYDTYLSKRADPHRLLYKRYQKLAAITADAQYFLHSSEEGQASAITVSIYKEARAPAFDLAILESTSAKVDYNSGLEWQRAKAKIGAPIQVIGYPASVGHAKGKRSENLRTMLATISNGKITAVKDPTIDFDALVTKGNSGGPLLGGDGKVLGVVVTRSMTKNGQILPKGGKAISVLAVKSFAPELFAF